MEKILLYIIEDCYIESEKKDCPYYIYDYNLESSYKISCVKNKDRITGDWTHRAKEDLFKQCPL